MTYFAWLFKFMKSLQQNYHIVLDFFHHQSEILKDCLRPSLGMKRLNPIENFAESVSRFLIGCFDLIPRGANDLKCLSFKNKLWQCGGCDFKLLFPLIFSAVTEQPYQDFLSSFLPSSPKRASDKNTSSQRAFMFRSFVPFFTLLRREFDTFLLHKKKSVCLPFRDILHELKPYLHPMVHSTLKILYIILSLIHYLLNIKHFSQLLVFSPTACTNLSLSWLNAKIHLTIQNIFQSDLPLFLFFFFLDFKLQSIL